MNPSKRAFTKLQNDAIRFAMDAHGTQRRKGSVVPYIVHPIEVAATLGKLYPDSHDLIIAGYLHDVLEDTDRDENSIDFTFNARVLELVKAVTSGPFPSWRAKRQSQLDKIAHTEDLDIVRLKAADMLSNATSIAFDYHDQGNAAFDKFKGSQQDVIWYYTSAAIIIVDRLAEESIGDHLSDQIEAFTS